MPKTPENINGQGSFFSEEQVSHGAMDPEHYTGPTVEITPVPGGTFEATKPVNELDFSEPELAAAVHDETVSRRNRLAQTGKHSPLQREGSYSALRPGDVLPGFGVVKYGNLQEAQAHAAMLDAARKRC
jgi:hypothetical protein